MARKDDHLDTHSRGHRGCDVGGGHPEGGWVSADGSCGLRSLGDQERPGWAGIAGAGRGGGPQPQPHAPGFHTAPDSTVPDRWPPGPSRSSDKGPAQPGHRNEDSRTTCGPGKRASTILCYFSGTEPKVTRKNKCFNN